MVFIKKLDGGNSYEAKHTQEWPFPKAEDTVTWFALGWAANNPKTLHVQSEASAEAITL